MLPDRYAEGLTVCGQACGRDAPADLVDAFAAENGLVAHLPSRRFAANAPWQVLQRGKLRNQRFVGLNPSASYQMLDCWLLTSNIGILVSLARKIHLPPATDPPRPAGLGTSF